jgi:ubiquinone/menaquinone biosynthesis C-methylase UbiE
MAHNVCPWWLGYFLASPIRKLRHNPKAIVTDYVAAGMTVLEPGPGMGFFTLERARLVGSTGKVIAIDIQAEMLKRLGRKLDRAGLKDRVELRLTEANSLGVDNLKGKVDFVLSFAMVHEVPDPRSFFKEVYDCMKKGGRMLFSEPAGHVTAEAFGGSTKTAADVGFIRAEAPTIKSMRSVVLQK